MPRSARTPLEDSTVQSERPGGERPGHSRFRRTRAITHPIEYAALGQECRISHRVATHEHDRYHAGPSGGR